MQFYFTQHHSEEQKFEGTVPSPWNASFLKQTSSMWNFQSQEQKSTIPPRKYLIIPKDGRVVPHLKTS